MKICAIIPRPLVDRLKVLSSVSSLISFALIILKYVDKVFNKSSFYKI